MPSREQMVQVLRERYSMAVGERTAAWLLGIVNRPSAPDDERFEMRGRDLVTGLPLTCELTVGELRGVE